MRQRDKQVPKSAEETVGEIRRATRRQFSAEEKIRIVLEGLRLRRARQSATAMPVRAKPQHIGCERLDVPGVRRSRSGDMDRCQT